MAPKPGTDGFLAPKAKLASAGILPALAAALALALAGCGGGGSGTQSQSVSSSKTSAEQQATSPTTHSAKAPPSGQGQASPGAAGDPATPAAPGAKHGAQVKPPKGSPERAPSAAEKAHSTLASLSLQSPDLAPGPNSESKLAAAFTCDGKDSWPTLQWQGVPPGTAELVLFVLALEPVDEALFFNWALAGLDPGLTSIQSAKLPKGAIVGKNSLAKQGYSICPPPGKPETYIFALYALPQKLPSRPGFDPAALRKEILALSGNVGLLAASYGR